MPVGAEPGDQLGADPRIVLVRRVRFIRDGRSGCCGRLLSLLLLLALPSLFVFTRLGFGGALRLGFVAAGLLCCGLFFLAAAFLVELPLLFGFACLGFGGAFRLGFVAAGLLLRPFLPRGGVSRRPCVVVRFAASVSAARLPRLRRGGPVRLRPSLPRGGVSRRLRSCSAFLASAFAARRAAAASRRDCFAGAGCSTAASDAAVAPTSGSSSMTTAAASAVASCSCLRCASSAARARSSSRRCSCGRSSTLPVSSRSAAAFALLHGTPVLALPPVPPVPPAGGAASAASWRAFLALPARALCRFLLPAPPLLGAAAAASRGLLSCHDRLGGGRRFDFGRALPRSTRRSRSSARRLDRRTRGSRHRPAWPDLPAGTSRRGTRPRSHPGSFQ